MARSMQLPEQGILEAVPQLVAGALLIGKGEQGQQIEIFGIPAPAAQNCG